MAADDNSPQGIDPDLAGLLDNGSEDGAPSFDDLFDDNAANADDSPFDSEGFEKITQIQVDPQPWFGDKSYYQTVLTGEGDISKRVHANLRAFLAATDAQEKSAQRSRLIPIFWELAKSIAGKIRGDIHLYKKLFLRFSFLLPTMITADQRQLLSTIPLENGTGEPVFYVDEWLNRVASGQVNASATDETKPGSKNQTQKVSMQAEKTKGSYEAQLNLVRGLSTDISSHEGFLKEKVEHICTHERRPGLDGVLSPLNDAQRSMMSDVNGILRKLGNLNRELERNLIQLDSIQEKRSEIEAAARDAGVEENTGVDSEVVIEEMSTIRQMAKMTVGRQGNHFPMLYKQYFRASILDLGTRENIINVMAMVEALDQGLFLRTFKQQTNRIVPNIILVPTYGDLGVCWEPFERFNRASSRGRIAIPMYSKDLKAAVISALADLRWQVAKEKAAHYWMEEGLTGRYYQWFTEEKLKGDVKDQFISDYILWITKESEGTQKLERGARGVFWRQIPFPQDVKDNLKNRGFVYSELYKKDQNRSMSDGY